MGAPDGRDQSPRCNGADPCGLGREPGIAPLPSEVIDGCEATPWAWTAGAREVRDAASELFEQPVAAVEVEMEPSQWEEMNRRAVELDIKAEYTKARVKVDGEFVGEVGVRPKGHTTLRRCFDESGERTCDKISYKLKFSEFWPSKRFRGLKRLNLHSSSRDDSMLREYLAYGMFRRMGVPAPRVSHAELIVNGQHQGVYVMVEEVDGRFLASRFPRNDDGNLYKDQWPSGSSAELYSQRLQTNEETPDHAALMKFQTQMESASDDRLPSTLARWMDMDLLRRHVTVDRAIANWDGPLSFRLLGPGAPERYANHNFFLYQDEHGDRFTLIPWDMDHAFKPWNRCCDDLPAWDDVSVDCETDGTRAYVALDRNYLVPSCEPVVRALGLAGPGDAVERLLGGPFLLEGLRCAIADKVRELESAVSRDPDRSVEHWLANVVALEDQVASLHAALAAGDER